MSRSTFAALRLARTFPCVILAVAIFLQSSTTLSAATAPQLLPYTVSIVAGGGTYGGATKYTVGNSCGTNTGTTAPTALSTVGDGCLATQVYFSGNAAVADSEGNVFIVDYTNKLIRRVDAHTGIITTVGGATTTATSTVPTSNPTAGAFCSGSSGAKSADAFGDGCPATEVLLTYPEAIALDPQGDIWFTDYYLGAVREIVKSTGIIQTVVNQSILTPPSFISNGLTPTAGVGYVGYNANNVTTGITGVTAAEALLYRPYGLAFDKNGNLYIAENYDNVVDAVNLGSTTAIIAGISVPAGQISTIAGSGCARVYETYVFGETASSSTNPTQKNMSCDGEYGATNGATSPYPSTGSELDSPYQVAVDNSGNIYIADEYNYDVRVINGTTGDISTFAGEFASGSGERMSAVINHTAASSTKLANIYGVATDSLGNVYIGNYDSASPFEDGILRVDQATDDVYVIAGQGGTAAPTADTAQAGATYCSGATHAVGSGTLPDVIGDGCPGTEATIWKPYFLSVDAAGNVYVADQGDILVRKVSVGTQFPATTVGTPVSQTIEIHFGVGDSYSTYNLAGGFGDFSLGTISCNATNADGTTDCQLAVTFNPSQAGLRTAPLVVTATPSGLVSTFQLTGTGLAPALAVDPGTQATLASTGLTAVNNIALDDAGNVYAAVPGASSIVEFAHNSNGVSNSIGSSLAGANAVAVDAAGNVYAALASGSAPNSGSVVELPYYGGASYGTSITVGVACTSLITSNCFTDPSGVAVDSYGNLYVADSSEKSVTEILAGTGAQVTLLSGLGGPNGVAVDSYGNVFVADTVNNDVVEIPFNGSAAITLGPTLYASSLDAPYGVAVDAAGSLYVADSKNSRIAFIPNENGTLNPADFLPIITGLGTPSGVAVAANGTVYVSDSYANAIYAFTRNSAAINLGNVLAATGGASGDSNTAAADIISMGTQPAAFGSAFTTESGTNQSDFALTPTSLPTGTELPAGYGAGLTASFTPTALGGESAAFTFDSTAPSTQPDLSLSGTGIQPHVLTQTQVALTQPNWTYGQDVGINISVSVAQGEDLTAPTGSASVYVDGATTPAGAPTLTQGTTTPSTTTPSTASFTLPGLSAGSHSVLVKYSGDADSSASQGTLSFSLNVAPLIVNVNNASAQFDAQLPTFTGGFVGVQNGDVIGVNYSTLAVQGSPVVAGGYAINANVTGSAVSNYSVQVNPGTLTILPDTTLISVGTSAASVNATEQVTLTATVSNATAYSIVTVPGGTVTFYNTVGGVTTQIGQPATISGGVASINTTFAVGSAGQTINNSITAAYSDTVDLNFLTSNSAPVAIASGVPTVLLTPAQTGVSLTVAPGQNGLMYFNMVPAFGYNGTITFSCNTPTPTVTCTFSPASITATGASTNYLIAVTVNTVQPGSTLYSANRPSGKAGSSGLPIGLAILPGLGMLFGFGKLRRKLLHGYRPLLLAALCLIGLGALSGCGSAFFTTGTPAGSDVITVVASGTGGSFASTTQQFTFTLTVQ